MSAQLTPTHTPAPTLRAPIGEHVRHKGIRRVDNPAQWSHGYEVDVRLPGGGKQRKFFADQKHGGREGSLAAALALRDSLFKECEIPPARSAPPCAPRARRRPPSRALTALRPCRA